MLPLSSQSQPFTETLITLSELIEKALVGQSVEDFSGSLISVFSRILKSDPALIYIVDSRLNTPILKTHGIQAENVFQIEKLCAEQVRQCSRQTGLQHNSVSVCPAEVMDTNLKLYYLRIKNEGNALIGLNVSGQPTMISTDLLKQALGLIANAIDAFLEQIIIKKKLLQQELYMSVSSMLTRSTDINGLMEATLYCCMEAVSAEAGSILLLDDEKKYFYFYQVEGNSKPLLTNKIFPADRGLAGFVIQNQEAALVNDVPNDPRFYKGFDTETGFYTKNMIAIPLVAKDERIGVLEILNKIEGPFTTDDMQLLLLIAEEIAFAIRNAKLFEYVVNSYCKMRQGQRSCQGCKRPLGSWTPCINYRKTSTTFPDPPKHLKPT